MKRKGFTLIELTVVMGVMALLLALTVPGYMRHMDKADYLKMKTDMRSLQQAVREEQIENRRLPKGEEVSITTVYNNDDIEVSGGTYYKVETDLYTPKLDNFVMNDQGEVFYKEAANFTPNPGGGGGGGGGAGSLEPTKPPKPTLPHLTNLGWQLAGDEAFSGDTNGNFKYIGGNKVKVIIPDVIKGVDVTSYKGMFSGSTGVEGVASLNPNVTDMSQMFNQSTSVKLEVTYLNTEGVTNMVSMFRDSKAKSLNLSNFDTSNVTNMRYMFASSQATSLDLSLFDTSNVTDMESMFQGSQATLINLSSFDTGKVTSMRDMFSGSKATSLDLSSFDTSKVISEYYMFHNSPATTGYARTETDKNKLNGTFGRPSTLTFELK